MGKIALGVLTLILLFAFSGSITEGVHTWRTDDVTQSFASVTTGGGETSANVTLSRDLFRDDVTEVISITSNLSGENPVASSYSSTGNQLEVGDLNASSTRTLTVEYYSELLDDIMQTFGPFIVPGIFLAIIGGVIWMTFKRR